MRVRSDRNHNKLIRLEIANFKPAFHRMFIAILDTETFSSIRSNIFITIRTFNSVGLQPGSRSTRTGESQAPPPPQ